uniref:SDR family NAD(P)-dependent oxidoreductase n=1 Tax=Thaumasiovibrio occultus TaxID=1891184 RepID=UPI000B353CB7|nr:SDR family NAD(P)-dependent oxidoreductase [Thaumasiovibrio occultus]
MQKVVLITGATDGIGLATAQLYFKAGFKVLLHGRSSDKLAAAVGTLTADNPGGDAALIETYQADLSDFSQLDQMIADINRQQTRIDVLINNAGVFKIPQPIAENGLDLRFVVNILAPIRLTQGLSGLFSNETRVINLSSAAQAPVELAALNGQKQLADDFEAYAQSKLALTVWTRYMADQHPEGPVFIAVNPGSLLASKMVKQGFGVEGKDLSIGAKILLQAGVDAGFASVSGLYFDNDVGQFSRPHPAAENQQACSELLAELNRVLTQYYPKP